MGRLSRVINAKSEITAYTYDLNGNMLTQTDGNGNITTFEYNAANKLAKRIDDGGRKGTLNQYLYDNAKVESYTYNADGNMATKTDRNGKTAAYVYDIHGRLLSQTIDKDAITYTYDNNGNQLSITNSTGTTRRTYDEMGRVTAKYVSGMGTSTFQYDILDATDAQWGIDTSLLTAGFYGEGTKDVKGNKTVKIFDKAGRLKYVIADGQKTTYNYDPNGNRASVVYQSGASETYTYNKDNQNTQLINKKPDDSEMDNYSYTYDAAHNQLSKTETIDGVSKGTTNYTYDALNRLESVKEPTGKLTEYTYDKGGNRETETVTQNGTTTVTTYSYNEQNRLMDTMVEVSGTKTINKYFYDNNGNMTKKSMEQVKQIDPGNPPQAKFGMFIYGQKDGATENAKPIVAGTASYEYDVWNQMVKAATADGTTVNKYNGEGYRVEKDVNGTVTKYLYEADKVILEIDGKGKQTARNIYGTNLLTRTTDGQTLNYMYNGHADVTALLDVTGTVKAKYYYDAFGTPIAEGTSENGINNPIRYAGYQYDNETGLSYLNARMYDSKIARFMQEDTYRGQVKDPLSLNLYTYCHNEPIMYFDPTGHTQKNDNQYSTVAQALIIVQTQKYDQAASDYAKAKKNNDSAAMATWIPATHH